MRWILLLALIQTTNAATIMWVVENQSDNLYRIDTATLTATLVGPSGINVNFGGIGFGSDGTLYVSNTPTINSSNLYTVNQSTGAFALVGPGIHGIETFDIRPGTADAYGLWFSSPNRLVSVNLGTGATSVVAPVTGGLSTTSNSAFAPDGTYYSLDELSDQLYTINTSTGVSTLIGALGVNAEARNLSYNPGDGSLWFIQSFDAAYTTYRVNPATGAATLVGNITGLPNNASQQITMATINVNSVPEPSTVWMVLAGAVLAGWRARAAHRG